MKEKMKEKMTKKELYEALYTDLEAIQEDSKKNQMRKNTLKNLLGVDDNGLKKQAEKYNIIQDAREKLGNKDAEETELDSYFEKIAQYWGALHYLYVCYLTKCKENLGDDKTINKILIYEAPPMPSKKNGKNIGKINYILAESCGGDCTPLKDGKPCEDCKINCNLLTKEPKGDYYTTIKNLSKNETENENIQDILVDQGILFIDLCPLPLPMTTDIRKGKWSEELDGKPLTVVLLELALGFALEQGVKISEKPIIAMGTPTATSQSIYFYFEKMINDECPNPYISIDVKGNVRNIDFSTLLNINRKYDSKNQILPLYQSNIIAGSNTPNLELLKRIF